jgi:hypothetical protein
MVGPFSFVVIYPQQNLVELLCCVMVSGFQLGKGENCWLLSPWAKTYTISVTTHFICENKAQWILCSVVFLKYQKEQGRTSNIWTKIHWSVSCVRTSPRLLLVLRFYKCYLEGHVVYRLFFFSYTTFLFLFISLCCMNFLFIYLFNTPPNSPMFC